MTPQRKNDKKTSRRQKRLPGVLLGPMDYTPGLFNNVIPSQFCISAETPFAIVYGEKPSALTSGNRSSRPAAERP